ncbi:NUMOD3 domain-containing DNA-binding protein [Streptomyces sp. NPDC058417]|uniref:NUMOD3 domain-containing DNA-binding protein n=1 Tax=unclassified Streptomyces TaxID=2593676 RepID=UPI003646F6FA
MPAQKGKQLSDEHKAKISTAKAGKSRQPFSDEHRAKLSAAARKTAESMGPEALSAASRKGKETMGPEARSAASRKGRETMGPEARSAAIRKGHETRKKNAAASSALPLGGPGSGVAGSSGSGQAVTAVSGAVLPQPGVAAAASGLVPGTSAGTGGSHGHASSSDARAQPSQAGFKGPGGRDIILL